MGRNKSNTETSSNEHGVSSMEILIAKRRKLEIQLENFKDFVCGMRRANNKDKLMQLKMGADNMGDVLKGVNNIDLEIIR